MTNISIWGENIPGFNPEFRQEVPTLKPYLVASDRTCGAIIVCPGGGYTHKAAHEGGVVAEWLNSIGISAFVLDYRVAPYRHPCPMEDARRAIQYVKAKADEFNINANQVGILGFSAGGHLAAAAAIHYLKENQAASDHVARVSSRPDCLILCYPVISLQRFYHKGSRNNLLGMDAASELVKFLSLENQVQPDMPPTFIWHTADDQSVPVENSLMFASALSKNNIDFEMHVFSHGRHGLGLANEQPDVGVWKELCSKWLTQIGFK